MISLYISQDNDTGDKPEISCYLKEKNTSYFAYNERHVAAYIDWCYPKEEYIKGYHFSKNNFRATAWKSS